VKLFAMLRESGGLPVGLGVAALAAVAARTTFYLLPMQVPVLAGAVVDVLTGASARVYGWDVGATERTLSWLALLLVGVAVAQGVTSYLNDVTGARVGKRLTSHLRLRLIEAWEHAPIAVHRRFDSGELLGRTLNETGAAGQVLASTLIELPSLALRVVFPVVMLLVIDPWLALFPLAVLPLQWILTRRIRRRLGEIASDTRQSRAGVAGLVKDNLDGIETVQAYGTQKQWLIRIQSAFDELEAAQLRSSRYGGLNHGVSWGLTAAGLALAWWQGSLRVMAGSLTVGDLVAFTGFVRFLNMPARRFSHLLAQQGQGLATLDRIAEVHTACRAAAASHGEQPLRVSQGEVRLQGLVVQCAGGRRTIAAILPPKTVSYVIGPGGSGKTTLLRTVAGLAPAAGGRVLVDGQDLAACTAASIREQVLFVAQEPTIFPGTIRENLLIGQPEAGDDDLAAACARTGFDQLVRRLPDGFDTPLGSAGITLSGTELRLLVLARVLLRRPAILLMDEPAGGLDTVSAQRIEQILAAAAREMTVIVASHRVSVGVPSVVVVPLDESWQRPAIADEPSEHPRLAPEAPDREAVCK